MRQTHCSHPQIVLFGPKSVCQFTTRRLANPSLVYANAEFGDAANWLDQYAYRVPEEQESRGNDFTCSSKHFIADRYGGEGIAGNGGSGRCGSDGRFQVKGIGRTPLVGELAGAGTNLHNDGNFDFTHAIQEIVWGEVLHFALPYGAVRGTALIVDRAANAEQLDRPLAPRRLKALLVRQFALRPAHFMRAPYFRPPPYHRLATDVSRVREAMTLLPSALIQCGLVPKVSQEGDLVELIEQGLFEMIRRIAKQNAHAKALRLMHGAINPSNICLDGRWIDFGTASSLPTHANTKVYGIRDYLPHFWDDSRYARIINDICFNIEKYSADGALFRTRRIAVVGMQSFFRETNSELPIAFAALAGFPSYSEAPYRAEAPALALGLILLRVARHSVERPFTPGSEAANAGRGLKLGLILFTLALWHDCETCCARLAPYLPDKALAQALVRAYRVAVEVAKDYAWKRGISDANARKAMALAALKHEARGDLFDRPSMGRRCSELVNSDAFANDPTSAVESYMAESILSAQVHFQRKAGDDSVRFASTAGAITYDPRSDLWCLGARGAQNTLSWDALRSHPNLLPVRALIGSHLTTLMASTMDS